MEYGPNKHVFIFETSWSRNPLQFVKAMRLNTRNCMDCQLRASRLHSEWLFVILLYLVERKYTKKENGHFYQRNGKHLSFSRSKVTWIDGSTEFECDRRRCTSFTDAAKMT